MFARKGTVMQQAQLRQQGKELAGQWSRTGSRTARQYARQIKWERQALEGLCRRLTLKQGQESDPATDWLLDNRYLAASAARAAERSMKQGRLPVIAPAGQFRLHHLCLLLTKIQPFEPEYLTAFLEGVQQAAPLTEQELSLLPVALGAAFCTLLRQRGEALERGESADDIPALVERLAGLRRMELDETLERLSTVDRMFRQDPAHVYPSMDAYSRHAYRQRLVKLAKQTQASEQDCAQAVLELAKKEGEGHIGTYLFPKPLGREGHPLPVGGYLSVLMLLTTLLTVGIGFALGKWWAVLLFLIPVSELVKQTVDLVLLHLVPPRPVFRMEWKQGLPPEGKTLCVIAALLTGADSIEELSSKLERYYLNNRQAGEQVCYGILADFPDRKREMNQEDEALLARMGRSLSALEKRYGCPFCLFFRRPAYDEREGLYRGRERKRGAILALVRYLRGRRGEMELRRGSAEALWDVRFLLVLDSDTVLTMDAVKELAGTMLHPLNTPVVDPVRRVVKNGYGILQPRVETELSQSDRSTFARLFSGLAGLDPYGGAVSDLYHDLFDEATFMGKGLIHIDAFLTCMEGRFPQNRILSHDLLEGSYLRCGWVSRTELLDSFPGSPLSWLARYHRWIRGDWQLLGWLGRRTVTEDGSREDNPVSLLARWKMLDNLRRSLVPPATLAALLAGLVGRGPLFLTALLAALLIALAQVITAAVELLCRKGQGSFRRFHSGIYAGFSGSVLRAGAELLFLPVQSWTALHAALLALWRQWVGHRHLLDWVTSGQSSKNGGSLGRFTLRFWPSVAAGLTALLCSPFAIGRLLGLAWTVSPLVFFHWSSPHPRQETLSHREQQFLREEAAKIWHYYHDNLRAQWHYLIPDNVQSMPDQGAALRTSPTNIGMALVSCLAALDLHLTDRFAALSLIGHQLTAMEGLERWRGHLYNWYDLTTAAPMPPRYVSTVDSGNLCACLLVLQAGLMELGEEDLSRRAAKLAAEMTFAPLYDARQGLFYIGYDAEQKQYSAGHYDLMASEARTTSYLAIARGEIPPRHWRRLSRAIVRRGRYTGMVSWSGTMFEYLMPRLFLPVYPDSLLWESLCFCLDQQRREGRRNGLPWGISESGFYELDLGQNYQYKAHGIPALTLRNQPTKERVIAPYAAYLALTVKPKAAIANLRRLYATGGAGRYGLYEALDYTPERGGSPKHPLAVKSWMAHHLGMSLLAVDNCLNDDLLIHRFFADPAMAAARELLQEKIPAGDAAAKGTPVLHIPQPRHAPVRYRRQGSGWEEENPIWGICANESYSVRLAASGTGESVTGCWTVLHPEGVQVLLREEATLRRVFPTGSADDRLCWEYRSGAASLRWQDGVMEMEQRVTVTQQHTGEQRAFTLTASQGWEGTLCLLLRPVLDRWDSYQAHPAFSRMCVESEQVEGGVRFRRRPGRGGPCPVLTVLWDCEDGAWSTSREDYLTRGICNVPRTGAVLDPCVALEVPLKLSPGERRTIRLALAVGEEHDSLTAAQALLGLPRPSGAALLDALASAMGAEQMTAALVLFSRIQSPRRLGQTGTPLGQPSLWPFAISGDLPIVTFRVQPKEPEQPMQLVAIHDALRKLGVSFDLVLLLPEQGDYRQSVRSAMLRALNRYGQGGMLGQKGGIHLVSGTEEVWQPILGMSTCDLQPGDRLEQPLHFDCPQPTRTWKAEKTGQPTWKWHRSGFAMDTAGTLPPVRWSHFLVNDRFGWRCDEAGTGHLWYQNAHLGQLTPWCNDPVAQTGVETLELWDGEHAVSLFASRDGIPVQVTYGPGYARWEKTVQGRDITLTAYVPPKQAVRIFRITLSGVKPEDRLLWRLRPQLSQRQSHAPWVRFRQEGLSVRLENPAGTMPGVSLLLSAAKPLLSAHWKGQWLELTIPAAEEMTLTAGVDGAFDPRSLLAPQETILRETVEWWKKRTCALHVQTPDDALNHYLSFWGYEQVLASRVLGRNGLYQCGGAVGFRDQLQDVLALLPFAPEIARAQIVNAAAHQFREGDVLHWWHPPVSGGETQGVRTRISDDLLWLPYALCRWVEETGETGLLQEQVPYLTGEQLREGENERYQSWSAATEGDTLYRHGVQAIECVLNRGVGQHRLCLMGTGDWNDGMNRMGVRGKGESVWLTWFFSLTLKRFAPLCGLAGDSARGERYRTLSQQLRDSAKQAWDGAWYLRAWDDDGNPVGSAGNPECAIDSIAQSFAVFAGERDDHARQAVLSAYDLLYDREHKLVRLLTPPFHGERDPGYLQSYPEGLRENGGQYTHAACWLAMALIRGGEWDKGAELLSALLPEHHDPSVYRAEPYVLAGDVYDAAGQKGRGGWSWYTGSAGWFCQAAVRELLGLRLEGGALTIRPALPSNWPGYQATWQGENFTLSIAVSRGERVCVRLDGTEISGGIPLGELKDGHMVEVTVK